MALVGSRWSLGLGAFALGCLVTLGVEATVLFAFFPGEPDRGRPQPDRGLAAYSRADLAALLTGKTEAEVLDAVGKPDGTSEDSQATYWHYRNRTRDPVTGATDSDVQVVFEKGRVAALNY
jgi:hypothetical protein